VAIFGRIAARQRLRRATRESLTIPAFSSPVDCTPWVTGGLWPAELSTITAQTATLAQYLRDDLQRIAKSANSELKVIKRAGMTNLTRQAEEARVIDEARARAVRRVESTIRHLHAMEAGSAAAYPRPEAGEPTRPDLDETRVIAAVKDVDPVGDADAPARPRWRIAQHGRHHAGGVGAGQLEVGRADVVADGVVVGAALSVEETQVIPVVSEVEPVVEAPADGGRHHAVPGGAQETRAEAKADVDRLNRLLEFVVRQEPRLNWAIGEAVDGSTVLVTDLVHGWIPPGIALPEEVRLLEPGRRSGKVSALIGEVVQVVTYAPGDSLRRSADFTATRASSEPRRLPDVDDSGRLLIEATRWRDGLPRIVHRLAEASAAGTGVIDQEVDVLRVHLDTARYQLLIQYPAVKPALLLDCLLLAATESFAVGDAVSANYHLAWYQHLAATPPPQE
jgi:hypothetical protein